MAESMWWKKEASGRDAPSFVSRSPFFMLLSSFWFRSSSLDLHGFPLSVQRVSGGARRVAHAFLLAPDEGEQNTCIEQEMACLSWHVAVLWEDSFISIA